MAATAAPSIVVFSLKDCPHCKRAKALLEKLGLVYEEISLTDYPEKRRDMLQLANLLTVPQIFIQGRLVTTKNMVGADALQALHESGSLQATLEALRDAMADDPRLRKPDYPPKPEQALPEAPEWPKISIGSQSLELPALVKLLTSEVEVKDHYSMLGLSKTPQSFSGKDLVDSLHKHKQFELKSREEAVEVADKLLHMGVFSVVDKGRAFSETGLFRFQVHEARFDTALNIARRCGPVAEAVLEPMGTLKRLKGQLSQLLATHTDDQGKIDYLAVSEDPGFLDYELAVSELQIVDIAGMEPILRKAFLINLYNTIIPHAFAKVGIGNSDLTRVAFFDGVSYVLNGYLNEPLSLNAIENGLLRGNRNAPFHLAKSIGSKSRHLKAVLECDHRIHFALNCGAKSCPPVKWFTQEALDEELQVVAMSFVEQDDNVKIDLATKTLSLSLILSWYSGDFGANKVEIANTLMPYARGEKQDQLKELLKGDFTIKHNVYDWSTDSRNARDFTTTNILGLLGW